MAATAAMVLFLMLVSLLVREKVSLLRRRGGEGGVFRLGWHDGVGLRMVGCWPIWTPVMIVGVSFLAVRTNHLCSMLRYGWIDAAEGQIDVEMGVVRDDLRQ